MITLFSTEVEAMGGGPQDWERAEGQMKSFKILFKKLGLLRKPATPLNASGSSLVGLCLKRHLPPSARGLWFGRDFSHSG